MAEAEYVRALDRGLAVLGAFGATRRAMTVAEVAGATGLSRATARRLLFTLEQLRFVRSEGRDFVLTPKVLTLGYAFIASQGVGPTATPHMEALAREIREAVTVAALLETQYVVIARADSDRVLTNPVSIGTTRAGTHASSLGKLLLANLDDQSLDAFLSRATLDAYTTRTMSNPRDLRRELAAIREQGWATSDGELEEGLVSVAAPITQGGRVVAAMNTASHTGRRSLQDMIDHVLPKLQRAASSVSDDLALINR